MVPFEILSLIISWYLSKNSIAGLLASRQFQFLVTADSRDFLNSV
jgi:hypothetical protein